MWIGQQKVQQQQAELIEDRPGCCHAKGGVTSKATRRAPRLAGCSGQTLAEKFKNLTQYYLKKLLAHQKAISGEFFDVFTCFRNVRRRVEERHRPGARWR